eukprot:3559148-Amphidinium_carterae.1
MRSTWFAVRGMRSTSSPFTGLGTYTDKDGRVVCVSGCEGEVATVCATSVDAHPKQLSRQQPWQPGETAMLSASELDFGPPPGDTWCGDVQQN